MLTEEKNLYEVRKPVHENQSLGYEIKTPVRADFFILLFILRNLQGSTAGPQKHDADNIYLRMQSVFVFGEKWIDILFYQHHLTSRPLVNMYECFKK